MIGLKGLKAITAAALISIGTAWVANAGVYSFGAITANGVGSPGIGESQMTVVVTDGGGGLVNFEFVNAGPLASSITDVYFDDDASVLNSITGLIGGAGVNFSIGAAPANLPSGNPMGFFAGFSADSDSPTIPLNGVNPGESLDVLFDLVAPMSFGDVITALDLGTLRIGIHVQAFDNKASESFINCDSAGLCPTPVPEPGPLGLLGIGFVALYIARRRRLLR